MPGSRATSASAARGGIPSRPKLKRFTRSSPARSLLRLGMSRGLHAMPTPGRTVWHPPDNLDLSLYLLLENGFLTALGEHRGRVYVPSDRDQGDGRPNTPGRTGPNPRSVSVRRADQGIRLPAGPRPRKPGSRHGPRVFPLVFD